MQKCLKCIFVKILAEKMEWKGFLLVNLLKVQYAFTSAVNLL